MIKCLTCGKIFETGLNCDCEDLRHRQWKPWGDKEVESGFLDNSHENMLIGELTPNCSIMPIGKSALETSIEALNLLREQINSTCRLSPMLINTFLNTKFALNIPIVEHIDLIKKINEFNKSLDEYERVRSIVGIRKFRSKK